MQSDVALLEAWRGGDRKAGDNLFTRHFDSIYRFFASKIRGDVEDLVQSTFLACVEGQQVFRGEASFRTYLFAIAKRLLYRRLRSNRRQPKLDFTITSLQQLGPSPSAAFGARQEQRLLLEGLRRIPIEMQVALELHYWEQLTGPQIAEVLEIPEGTVRSRLRRAREALVAQLEQLASSPEQLHSTLGNLDRWAADHRLNVAQFGDGVGDQ